MSTNGPSQTVEKDCSLLQTETLLRIFGGDVLQALRCGICMEFFEVPIVLPCGHTFCLHCLTELCRQAMQTPSTTCALQEVRIGCPQCRVLIYVSPILDRNVTCNFVVQSLIEALKSRKWETRQSKAVNTDEARVGSKVRLVGDLELERISQEVDRLSDALGKRSVLDLAYFEVDQIRRQHLRAEGARSAGSGDIGIVSRNPWKTCSNPRAPQSAAGNQLQQQKQWAQLMQQQKSVQNISHQHQRQQQQLPHHQHLYQQQQQRQLQRGCQREAMRSSSTAWSPSCAIQSSRFLPLASESSLPSQSTSLSSVSGSSSLAAAYAVAPIHNPLNSLRQQHRTHPVQPTQQQQQQQQPQQRQLLHRLEQQQPQQPQQQQQQQSQQPQTTHNLFCVRRQQELYHAQQAHPQQQPQQDHDKKQQQQQQQHFFQQQQSKSLRLLQKQAPYPMNEPQRQQQEQATGSKMAAVLPVQRTVGVEGGESSSAGQTGHPTRLDNDPAVMSYSYRAESVSNASSTNLP